MYMNGNQGITPVVELAGNNNAYPYPVYPMMGGFGGGFGSGFGGDGALWLIILLALIWNNNGNGNGFFGGNGGFDNGYAWLSNGQKEIMQNTNSGFDTLHLSNQIEGVRDGIWGISNQLCNVGNDITSAINTTAYNAEISANNRAVNQMQTDFALSQQLAQCCCDNRLATCQTQNIVQNEGNATRFADANNTRDIITNATANTQAILDKLCQLELDGKNDKIADLQRQLTMADLRASQTAQNAFISQGFANEVDQLYNRLSNCPVPTTPVYGRTPIFTCPNNNGCGCNSNYYGTNIM